MGFSSVRVGPLNGKEPETLFELKCYYYLVFVTAVIILQSVENDMKIPRRHRDTDTWDPG